MASENNLGEELLKQVPGLSETLTADQITLRERRRVRRWAIATASLWIVTTAYLLGLLMAYAVFIHPILNEVLTNQEYATEDMPAELPRAIIIGLKALLAWPVLLFLAAACTTVFTLIARRATLQQIQAGLSQISEQLKVIVKRESELGSSDAG